MKDKNLEVRKGIRMNFGDEDGEMEQQCRGVLGSYGWPSHTESIKGGKEGSYEKEKKW